MAGACKSCGGLYSFLFEYDTPRIVLIRSRKVGLMNRLVQLAILAYVIGWVFVWEKGYQETDSVVSSVTTKVKGVTMTNTSKLGLRIWDTADYVIPPQGENSVFIMTNMIITLNQTQGLCPELPDNSTMCHSDEDCKEGYVGTHSNGVQTGKCIHYTSAKSTIKTCEVFAWCLVEDDKNIPKPAFLKNAENFTLLVKNNIWYPKFNFTKRNILPNISKTYLKNCKYNSKMDPFCPIFRLRDVVEGAGQDFQEMAVEGGVMGLQINWDCDLDKPASRCVPKYTFRRIDNKDSAHTVSPGYNFRFAKYYQNAAGVDSRTLIKAYGIRFDIMVFGKAGKFDIIPTMINVGSGLALFGVATVLCDIIVLYFMKKRYYYREKKYKYVEDYELEANASYGSQAESQGCCAAH
ncbi:P2X purinoceptor 4 isoform X2 [Rhineura floridana]|uniref:P2X purinoceptor 4 isoform X2 n=1 Tax=Rhineura floridana TaxID=261503 RepID=UPI002AC84BE1|nr:P2X purinoceptor 4 isoform X2 [Rhineura floridana]